MRCRLYNFSENNYLLGHDLQSTTNEYTYDAHGNMIKMPHLQELKWDYEDNLKEVVLDASNNTAYYVYDNNGNRVRKVIVKGNIVEERFYVGDYEVYRKTTNGTLNIERKTLNIMDDKQKIAQIDSDETDTIIRYQLSNHLGSASLELDENADIISYEEYHPFGTSSYRSGRSDTEVSLKRYKYVGKERDEETGLYYYGARYYTPWIARFISVDPKAEEFSFQSPYLYAANNPIKFIDYMGMFADDPPSKQFLKGIGKGAVGYFKNIGNTIFKLVDDPTGTVKVIIDNATETENLLTGVADGLTLGVHSKALEIAEMGQNIADGNYEEAGETVGNKISEIATAYATQGIVKKKGELIKNIKDRKNKFSWIKLDKAARNNNKGSLMISENMTKGGTYKASVYLIVEGSNTPNLVNLSKSLTTKAKSFGATTLEIKGQNIINKRLNNIFKASNGRKLMGYNVKYTSNKIIGNNVILTKTLK